MALLYHRARERTRCLKEKKTKIGRPTENPKDFMFRVRLDDESLKKLNYLSEKQNISKSDVVRNGINIQYENEK